MTLKRTRRGLVAGLVSAVLASTLAACSAGAGAGGTAEASSAAEPDLSSVTLKVGVLDSVWAKLIEESGLFDDAPYEVETAIATFPQQVAGLNSGELDLAFYGVTTSVNQAGNDPVGWSGDSVPIKLIGGWAPDQTGDHPWFGVAVRDDAGIEALDDLEGHTWAVSTSGDAYPSYLALLEETALTDRDVDLLSFQTTPEQVAAFATGQADVFVGGFTSISELLTSGEAKILTTSKELGVPVLRGYAALTSTLEDATLNAAIQDWFVRFDELNSAYWDEHEQEIVDLYVAEQGIDEATAEYNWRSLEGTRARPFDDALVAGVQRNADLFHEYGAIENPVEDVSVLFDDSFNALIQPTPLL
jgi:sulfonate transport system substrate-binding protein